MIRRWGPIALCIALALAAPILAQATGFGHLVGLLTRLAIYGIAAASLDLLVGYGGLISLGHAGFFGLGGYTAGIIASNAAANMPLLGGTIDHIAPLIWLLAALIAAIAGAAIGWLSLRTSGVQFIMLTLAFGQLLHLLLNSLVPYGGDDGLLVPTRAHWPGIGAPRDLPFYYICATTLTAVLYALHRITKARFGTALASARMSERRTISLGYAPRPYRLVAFTISAAGMGLAGAMWADHAGFVSPDMAAWTHSGEFLGMVILGGVGTLFGPVVGAGAFLILQALFTSLTERWLLLFGLAVVLAVLFTRRGLYGLLARS